MSSQSNHNKINTLKVNGEITNLGGFPPIIYISQKNKKIKEFAQINNNDINIENISNLNILNIKNILGI